MSTPLANVLGVLGFLMALVSLGWHIWSWKAARREDLAINASLLAELGRRHHTIHVRIRNVGQIPVFISKVSLAQDINEPAQINTGGTTVQEIGRETHLVITKGDSNPLPPGASCEYCIPDQSVPVCRPRPNCRWRIIVSSERGKAWGVEGQKIEELVMDLAKSADNPNAN